MDHPGSRKGPYVPINDTNSIGLTLPNGNYLCGDCHVTDVHAVHTNGEIYARATYRDLNSTEPVPGMPPSVL